MLTDSIPDFFRGETVQLRRSPLFFYPFFARTSKYCVDAAHERSPMATAPGQEPETGSRCLPGFRGVQAAKRRRCSTNRAVPRIIPHGSGKHNAFVVFSRFFRNQRGAQKSTRVFHQRAGDFDLFVRIQFLSKSSCG